MRINLLMALGVMLLDMLKLGGIMERWHVPIQLPQPFVQIGIARPDVPDIALEVLDVDRVEADNGRVEADVRFGDRGPVVVG